MNTNLKDKRIYLQIPLEDYLNDVLGSIEHGFEKRPIGEITALIISMLPLSEKYCHIQFTEFDESKKLDKPILWRIKAWRDSFLRWQIEHRKSEKQRKEWNIKNENATRFNKQILAMATQQGLDINDPLVYKALQEMAHIAAAYKNVMAFKAIGAMFEIYNENE